MQTCRNWSDSYGCHRLCSQRNPNKRHLPRAIRTPMAEELIRRNPSLEKELVRDIPAGRLGKPEEIANAVLWLCSPQASFVDGHALLVDGAFSIH